MRPIEVEFAAKVLQRRKAAGLSQQDLSGLMRARGWRNFHQQTILKVEKGTRGVSLAEAVSLADSLGTDLRALLIAADPPFEDESRQARVQKALWQVSVISQEALS
jgi:transcriptional regulator with XRE-family HTH domain